MVHGGFTRMGNHNGHVFLGLVRQLYSDLAISYPELQRELERDEATIISRYATEGLAFFTKTLPRFGKAIDKALSNQQPVDLPGFSKRGGSKLSAFCWGFLTRVFNYDGMPKPDGDPGALLELRQLCFLLYKLELPYEDATVAAKVKTFIDLDNSLDFAFDRYDQTGQDLLRRARVLIGLLLRDFSLEGACPKHGPGAVAGREKPWEKMNFKFFVNQIDEEFKISDWYFLSPTHLCDDLQRFMNLEEVDFLLSRLESVPKDSRGPRLIGLEPLEYMWIQQAIKGKLYPYVESHPLTKGHINFTDQTINGSLALESSITRYNCTLDMKDASDRVSLGLVKYLFADTSLLPALLATRTPGVSLPNGETLMYKKFAPMGSALCFPVEAIVFWSLTVAALQVHCKMPLWVSLKSVYIFGDDIIIPTSCSSEVMRALPQFNLMFNEDKCCIQGFFRESCGTDAYFGVNVTPVKIKSLPPCFSRSYDRRSGKRRIDVDSPMAVASYVEYSNLFYERGYYKTAQYLERLVTDYLGHLPIIEGEVPFPLCFRSRSGAKCFGPKRWNIDLQRYETFTWDLRPVKHTEAEVYGWDQPFRSLVKQVGERGAWVYDIPYRSRLVKRWRPCR